ncbi:serine/threonine-protein phosphatase 7 long form-like protein [Cucumis melo var. makuwa]|uniref:Serine/threonine-protein phosphatase 7 long form-like protein n=1 Tax=Cucumis melo var. makuwa TaxID=1194695 RepID=A0A5D3BEI0_CUCMM|nr:serine/threonine-protein phosphatase 7 long form-like protein [Cucumis melo var. makuwa]TYJ97527.1 serine/threonine-protein phosphatase 7 long form-like protein [Cucumis melo var. makuwa]
MDPVRLALDNYIGRTLEIRDLDISYALWGVHDHAAGCCSPVGVTNGRSTLEFIPCLVEQFQELPPDADVVSVERYACAYILQLIEGFLFADKSNTLVHCMFFPLLFDFDQAGTYAWCAATLSWLYRELC